MSTFQFEFTRPKELNNSRVMSWFSYKNPAYQTESSNINGLNLGFSSKEDQHIILHHIREYCNAIGLHHKDLALANQIHSTNVLVVEKGGHYPNVDAFVSKTPGVALGIQVADCSAVLFGDFENKVIGAAHAGWRGAVEGIVVKTLQKMIDIGANPHSIHTYISPCLAKHNFEVGTEVADKFPNHFVNNKDFSKPHVDLKGLIFEQLTDSKILSRNIEMDTRCTIDHERLFYSYRRENETSGRMMGIIKLNKF